MFTYGKWKWTCDPPCLGKSILKREGFFQAYGLSDLMAGLGGIALGKPNELPLYKLKLPQGAFVTACGFGGSQASKLRSDIEFEEMFGGVCLFSRDLRARVRFVIAKIPGRKYCERVEELSLAIPDERNKLYEFIEKVGHQNPIEATYELSLESVQIPTELNSYHVLLPFVQSLFSHRFDLEFMYQIPLQEYQWSMDKLFEAARVGEDARSVLREAVDEHHQTLKAYVDEMLDTKLIKPLEDMREAVELIQSKGYPRDVASYIAPYVELPTPFVALEDLVEFGLAVAAKNLKRAIHGKRLDLVGIYFLIPSTNNRHPYLDPTPVSSHNLSSFPPEIRRSLRGLVGELEERRMVVDGLEIRIRGYKA